MNRFQHEANVRIRIASRGRWVDVAVDDLQSTVADHDLAPLLGGPGNAPGEVRNYGQRLCQVVFDASQRDYLERLEVGRRVLLDIPEPRWSALPWEALRGLDGNPYAARFAMTRWIESEKTGSPSAGEAGDDGFDILALPVAPIDTYHPQLATEQEYRNLASEALSAQKAVRLVKVRPPSLEALAATLQPQRATGLFFMGHGVNVDGRSMLAFENQRGGTHLVRAEEFADKLGGNLAFVVLNSCWSAQAGQGTEFGNLARGLVRNGVPLALGMRHLIPDHAALRISRALLKRILAGHPFEEAVRLMRCHLLERDPNGKDGFPEWLADWLATVPVCYTNRLEPVEPFRIPEGRALLLPDPDRLGLQQDLGELPPIVNLVGRADEIMTLTDIFRDSQRPRKAVLLHGMVGTGKTAILRAALERMGWMYDDRLFAANFAGLTRQEPDGQTAVDTAFCERFYDRFGRFYGMARVPNQTADRWRAEILERVAQTRCLLVFDNHQTLVEAESSGDEHAGALAEFLRACLERAGDVLVATRELPPGSWAFTAKVEVRGVAEKDGAQIFFENLPPGKREAFAAEEARRLSRLVQGHPLSLVLLAGRFADQEEELKSFVERFKSRSSRTETDEDGSGTLATVEAMVAQSVEGLAPELRERLETLLVFRTPFLDFLAVQLFEVKREAIQDDLDALVRLGLLSKRVDSFPDETFTRYEIQPLVRLYLSRNLRARHSPELIRRYGGALLYFAQTIHIQHGFERSPGKRQIVVESMADLETAMILLPSENGAGLALMLSSFYEWLDRLERARRLAETALELVEDRELPEISIAALIRLGDLMSKMGEPLQSIKKIFDRALTQYGQSGIKSYLGPSIHEKLGELAGHAGQYPQALAHHRDARRELDEIELPKPLSRPLEEANCDRQIAWSLSQLGRHDEAVDILNRVIPILKAHHNFRGAAIALNSLASSLDSLERYPDALRAYEQAIDDMHRVNAEPRAIAVIEGNYAMTLADTGQEEKAFQIWERASHVLRKAGDLYQAALVEKKYGSQLIKKLDFQKSLKYLWSAYQIFEKLGIQDNRETTSFLIKKMKESFHARDFLNLWRVVTRSDRMPDWLAEVESKGKAFRSETVLPQAQLDLVYRTTVSVLQPGNDSRREQWRQELIKVGARFRESADTEIIQYNDAVLSVVEGKPASLQAENKYYIPFQQIVAAVKAASGIDFGIDPAFRDVVAALNALFSAADPAILGSVLRRHADFLKRPEVFAYIGMLSFQARHSGSTDQADYLATLQLICKSLAERGEDAALASLETESRKETQTPLTRAVVAAKAILGSEARRSDFLDLLKQWIGTAESDEERLLYAFFRSAISGYIEQLDPELKTPALQTAWQQFRQIVASGGVQPQVYETIKEAALKAILPDAGEAAITRCANELTHQRNLALAADLTQWVDLIDIVRQFVEAIRAGVDIDAFKPDLTAEPADGANRRHQPIWPPLGPYRAFWRELRAETRFLRGFKTEPEAKKVILEYANCHRQSEAIALLLENRQVLLTPAARDELVVLEKRYAGQRIQQFILNLHLSLIDDALEKGLSEALTGSVALTFVTDDNTEECIRLFQTVGDLLSREAGERAIQSVLDSNYGRASVVNRIVRKRILFRRILELGIREAFEEDARLDKLIEPVTAFFGQFTQAVQIEAQVESVRKNETLLHDPDSFRLLENLAETAMITMLQPDLASSIPIESSANVTRAQLPEVRAGYVHSIQVLMQLLRDTRDRGIEAAFEYRRKTMECIIEFVSGSQYRRHQIARQTQKEDPDLLLGNHARELFFTLIEQQYEHSEPDRAKHLERCRAFVELWRERDVETAIFETAGGLDEFVRESASKSPPAELTRVLGFQVSPMDSQNRLSDGSADEALEPSGLFYQLLETLQDPETDMERTWHLFEIESLASNAACVDQDRKTEIGLSGGFREAVRVVSTLSFADSKLFPDIGTPAKERQWDFQRFQAPIGFQNTTQPENGSLVFAPNDRYGPDYWVNAKPRDADRQRAGDFLRVSAELFMLFHAMSHVSRGHLDYLQGIGYTRQGLDESQTEPYGLEEPHLTGKRFLEHDADVRALSLLLEAIRKETGAYGAMASKLGHLQASRLAAVAAFFALTVHAISQVIEKSTSENLFPNCFERIAYLRHRLNRIHGKNESISEALTLAVRDWRKASGRLGWRELIDRYAPNRIPDEDRISAYCQGVDAFLDDFEQRLDAEKSPANHHQTELGETDWNTLLKGSRFSSKDEAVRWALALATCQGELFSESLLIQTLPEPDRILAIPALQAAKREPALLQEKKEGMFTWRNREALAAGQKRFLEDANRESYSGRLRDRCLDIVNGAETVEKTGEMLRLSTILIHVLEPYSGSAEQLALLNVYGAMCAVGNLLNQLAYAADAAPKFLELQARLQVSPSDLNPIWFHYAAETLVQLGDLHGGKVLVDRALNELPEDPERLDPFTQQPVLENLLDRAAEIERYLKNFDMASVHAEKLIGLTQKRFQEHESENARVAFTRALTFAGRVAQDAGDYSRARSFFERVVPVTFKETGKGLVPVTRQAAIIVHTDLADTYFHQENFESAFEHLRKAIESAKIGEVEPNPQEDRLILLVFSRLVRVHTRLGQKFEAYESKKVAFTYARQLVRHAATPTGYNDLLQVHVVGAELRAIFEDSAEQASERKAFFEDLQKASSVLPRSMVWSMLHQYLAATGYAVTESDNETLWSPTFQAALSGLGNLEEQAVDLGELQHSLTALTAVYYEAVRQGTLTACPEYHRLCEAVYAFAKRRFRHNPDSAALALLAYLTETTGLPGYTAVSVSEREKRLAFAIEALNRAPAAFGTPTRLDNHAVFLERLGSLALSEGKLKKAEKRFLEMVSVRGQHLESDPGNPAVLMLLVRGYRYLCWVAVQRKRLKQFLRYHEVLSRIFPGLLKRVRDVEPEHVEALFDDLYTIWQTPLSVYADHKRFSVGYWRGLGELLRLIEEKCGSPFNDTHVPLALLNLGIAHGRIGDDGACRQAVETARLELERRARGIAPDRVKAIQSQIDQILDKPPAEPS